MSDDMIVVESRTFTSIHDWLPWSLEVSEGARIRTTAFVGTPISDEHPMTVEVLADPDDYWGEWLVVQDADDDHWIQAEAGWVLVTSGGGTSSPVSLATVLSFGPLVGVARK